MRRISITIVGLIAVALAGCEAAAPPPVAERGESAPAAPQPSAPAEPAPPEPERKPGEPAPTSNEATGQEALEKARALGAARAKKQAEAAAAAGAAPTDTPPAEAPPAEGPASPDGQGADSEPAPGDELTKAEVGVGRRGKNYGGPGFITTPIETMFTVEERIAFDVQIPNAMKLYKAAHDNKGPKTNDEFMKVIIQENGVQLPDLPEGSVYWYDHKTEELLVRKPKQDS